MKGKCKIRILIIVALVYSALDVSACNNLLIFDYDGDEISDTVYIDTLSYRIEDINQSRIVCKLSTQLFNPIVSSNIYYDPDNTNSRYLSLSEGDLVYSAGGMRQGEEYFFMYEKSTHKIRLSQAYYYDYGNVVNDGAHDITIDLLLGKISGEKSFYNYKKEKLKNSKVREKRVFLPIYLEHFSDQIYLLDE